MTYAELLQSIQDTIENSNSQFVTDIPDMVKRAEDRILRKAKLKNFRTKSTATAMAADNEYWIPPSGFLAADVFKIVVSDVHTTLLPRDLGFIREMYPDRSATGTPKYYAQTEDDEFLVGPTPDANYATELWYFFKPTSIVTAGNSWLGDNAETTLFYASLIEACIYLKIGGETKQLYIDGFNDAMRDLKREAEGKTTTDTFQSGEVKQGRA